MENSHAMLEIYWRQKQQQAKAHYTKNTQLYEDNQVKKKHPEVCDEESEERIELFFSGQRSITSKRIKKNNKKKIKHKESEHT